MVSGVFCKVKLLFVVFVVEIGIEIELWDVELFKLGNLIFEFGIVVLIFVIWEEFCEIWLS